MSWQNLTSESTKNKAGMLLSSDEKPKIENRQTFVFASPSVTPEKKEFLTKRMAEKDDDESEDEKEKDFPDQTLSINFHS